MNTIYTYAIPMAAGLALLAAGCGPNAAQNETGQPKASTSAAQTVPATARITFSDLPVPPKPAVTTEFVAKGKAVYSQNCVACHGVKGDGKGDAAAFLLPKPRDFTAAKYRLRSTGNSELPTDVDLFRSVSFGMAGTPMPPWKHMLSEDERWAVVEYIKTFSPRFTDTNVTPATVVSLGTPPAHNADAIAQGKALFTKMNCTSCHGETGHGDGPSALTLTDDSGLRIKPRDFGRPAAFKSGYSTKEIVRTILTGFNGTPMVGFHGTVSDTDAWKIAYYVETFARPDAPAAIARASQNFLEREQLGEPDVRIKLTERAWRYDPEVIRVKQGQVVEITFEPTDNGLGVGHGFAISSYDESAFINGVMVGAPKKVKFRANHAGKFTYYCATQCSTEKLHPLMNGTLIVEERSAPQTASAN